MLCLEFTSINSQVEPLVCENRTQKTWNHICLGNDCHLFTPNKYLTCYGYSFIPAMKASCLTDQGYANLPFYVSGNAASWPVSKAWFYIYLPQRQTDFCFGRYFFYVLKGLFDFSLFEISAWEVYNFLCYTIPIQVAGRAA